MNFLYMNYIYIYHAFLFPHIRLQEPTKALVCKLSKIFANNFQDMCFLQVNILKRAITIVLFSYAFFEFTPISKSNFFF